MGDGDGDADAAQRTPTGGRFLRLWGSYALAGAMVWCSLAGVGFILMLAFLADASPTAGRYLGMLGEVVLVLFVYPIAAWTAAAACLAGIHLALAAIFGGRGGNAPLSAAPVGDRDPRPLPGRAARPRSGGRPLGFARGAGCVFAALVALFGTLMILGNFNRTIAEDGLGPAVRTAGIVAFLSIFLPGLYLRRCWRRWRGTGRAAPPEMNHRP